MIRTEPSTAAAKTCLRRKNTRPPGIICKRLQITAVRRGQAGRNGVAVMSAELGYLRAGGHASCKGPLQPQQCREPFPSTADNTGCLMCAATSDAHGFEGPGTATRRGYPRWRRCPAACVLTWGLGTRPECTRRGAPLTRMRRGTILSMQYSVWRCRCRFVTVFWRCCPPGQRTATG